MSDFIAVGGAILQDIVSRTISFALGKRKEKTSQGEYMERLRMAVHEVEFVLERTAKLPITEVSLLREKIELKRDFVEASAFLLSSRHKKRQGQQEVSQVVSRSSSPPGLATCPAISSFIAATKDELCLSCDDVDRFERLADSARNILARVESGCSMRRWMHSPCPLVRHLLEWKTLLYRTVQADQEHSFVVWPARLEERGVEAAVHYWYFDQKRPDKSFYLILVLRLSESTDIVGIAIKCLQSLASLVSDTAATGELTLLAGLQDVSYPHPPPWIGTQENFREMNQYCPNPLCCKAKANTPCANTVVVSSEISQVFPVEVIFFSFECFVSAPEYSLHSSTNVRGKRSVMRNIYKAATFTQRHFFRGATLRGRRLSAEVLSRSRYTFEVIGDNARECIDVSIQQIGETVRPRAINCFLRQPKVTRYEMGWATKHGSAYFTLNKM